MKISCVAKVWLATTLLLGFCASFAGAQSFVYVNNNDPINNSVSGFAVSTTGALTPVPGSPFSTAGLGAGGGYYAANRIVVVNNFLYATNTVTNSIAGFSIDTTTGALTPVPGSPFVTSLKNPITMAGNASSTLLLVSDSSIPSKIEGFQFDASGALTPLYTLLSSAQGARSPIDGVAISPNGKFFAATNLSGMEMYAILADLTLSAVPGMPFPKTGTGSVTSAAFTCDGTRLYAAEANFQTTVDGWVLSSTGVLTPITGSPFTQTRGFNSNVAIADPGGKFVFVATQASDTTPVFSINANGSLTPVPGSPFSTRAASGLAITSDGKFLEGANFVEANSYSVAENGTAALVSNARLPGGAAVSVATYPPSGCGPSDAVPPTSNAQLSPAPNASGWNNGNLTVTISATDDTGGSGVKSITFSASGAQTIASTTVNGNSASITMNIEGTTTISFHATDVAGNIESPDHTVMVRLDKTIPAFNCALADGVWHAADISIACTASDAISGLAAAGDASFSLSTTVASGTETSNANTNSHLLCDLAENCTSAGPFDGNLVDKKAPTITITAPANNGTYTLNSITGVASNYQCVDGGSGLQSCVGSVTNGTNFSTSSVGAKTFIVNAKDNVNNASTLSNSYKVLYASGGICYGDAGHQILQPINADGSSVWKRGATVPAKFRVCDANGVSIGTPDVVTAFNLVQVLSGTETDVDEVVNSTTPDTAFRWDATEQQWIFNVSTQSLTANQTYVFQIELNDGSSIFFQFGVR
jgi:hypothetical protein